MARESRQPFEDVVGGCDGLSWSVSLAKARNEDELSMVLDEEAGPSKCYIMKYKGPVRPTKEDCTRGAFEGFSVHLRR